MEDFIDFMVTSLFIILLMLTLCIPINIYLDYKVKERALDIYENTGILINIDMEDIIQEGEK